MAVATLAFGALLTGCAHRAATTAEGMTTAQVCERARNDALRRSAARESAAWDAAHDRMMASSLYDLAALDYRAAPALYAQARSIQSLSRDGFRIREVSPWSERCRLARAQEREAPVPILEPELD